MKPSSPLRGPYPSRGRPGKQDRARRCAGLRLYDKSKSDCQPYTLRAGHASSNNRKIRKAFLPSLRRNKTRLPALYRLGTGTQAVVAEAHRNDRKIRKASQPSLQKIRPDCFVADVPRNDRLDNYPHVRKQILYFHH